MGKRGPIKKLWKPDPAWFWSHVDFNGPPCPRLKTKCWTWGGWRNSKGYGLMRPTTKAARKKFATLSAHRVAWELRIGPVPKGGLVLHHCDNPACVRPSHLFLGDDKANMDDMFKKKRGHKARGEDQHLSKLTESAVRTIRKERAKTLPTPLKDLARRFNVSLVAVSYAANGKTWKHVT